MRLTVDASVVIKWSVPEAMAESANLLRAHRLELHAPDLLLAELVNVIWKKSRRREIPDANRHLSEVGRLSEDIALHSMSSLIARAGQIALELDHPVYDCLYLACAEKTESPFVTADRRLATKVDGTALDITIRYLGAEEFREDIGAAGRAPVITRATVEALVDAFHLLSATGEGIGRPDKDLAEAPDPNELRMDFESPAHRRISAVLQALSEEERIDLLAIGWFGRPDGWDWQSCFEYACSEIDTAHENYLIRNGQFWRRGTERLFDIAL